MIDRHDHLAHLGTNIKVRMKTAPSPVVLEVGREIPPRTVDYATHFVPASLGFSRQTQQRQIG